MERKKGLCFLGTLLCLSCFLFLGPVWGAEGDINRLVSSQLVATLSTPYLSGSFRESPDSRHIAFVIQKGVQKAAVVDGHVGQAFDDIDINSFQFAPDSQGVVYIAKTGNKYTVVRNGKIGKLFNNIAQGSLILSPDGQKLVYAVQLGSKWCVMVNDKAEAQYDAIGTNGIRLSPDGLNLAYPARFEGQWMVVRNGVRGKTYGAIVEKSLTFSPNGKKLAYIAKIEGKWSVVADEVAGKTYENLGINLCFSPDGTHIAYAVKRDGFWRLVSDAKEGPPYDEIASSSITYSPDGKHMAYAALAVKKWVVVADRKQGPEVDGIGDRSVQYSPDGRQLFYIAKYDKKWAMVIDGEPGIPVDGIGRNSLGFSPDGEVNVFCAMIGSKWSTLIQGVPGERYDSILTGHGGRIVFDAPDLIHYLAMKGQEVYLVKEKIKIDENEKNSLEQVDVTLNFNPPDGVSFIQNTQITTTMMMDNLALGNYVMNMKTQLMINKKGNGYVMRSRLIDAQTTVNGIQTEKAAVKNLSKKPVYYDLNSLGQVTNVRGLPKNSTRNVPAEFKDILPGNLYSGNNNSFAAVLNNLSGTKITLGEVWDKTFPYPLKTGEAQIKMKVEFPEFTDYLGHKLLRIKFSMNTDSQAFTDLISHTIAAIPKKDKSAPDFKISDLVMSITGDQLLAPETMLVYSSTAIIDIKMKIGAPEKGFANFTMQAKIESANEYQ